MPFNPGSTVIRANEAPPNRATILSVRGMTVHLQYEEGGEGWWPIDALEEVIEGPDYSAFYNAFLNSNAYQTRFLGFILNEGFEVEGKLITLVAIALQDAMAGRVPLPSGAQPNSLQSAIWLMMAKVGPSLTQDDIAELQGLFTEHGLDSYYSLVPPQQ